MKINDYIKVIKTGVTHLIVESFMIEGNEDYFKLDNGTHYWRHELILTERKTNVE